MKKSPYHISHAIRVCLIAILVFTGCYMMAPKSYHIEQTLNATQISLHRDHTEKAEVKIAGVLETRLLRGDSFVGKIEIQGFPETSGELLPITFNSKSNDYGSLTYRYKENLEFIGYVRMNRDATDVIICLFEELGDGRKVWSQNEGTVIAFPSNDISKLRELLYE